MEEDPTQRGLFDVDDGEMVEDNAIYAEIFGLVLEDKPLIERLVGCVRTVIARPDVSAYQVHKLAELLFALERLPAPTPHVDVGLDVGRRLENGESRSWELHLDSDEFRLHHHAYVILDPRMGGDSLSSALFEAYVGGARTMENPNAVLIWLEAFEIVCADLEECVNVESYGDGPTDWESVPDPDLWNRIDRDGGWFLTNLLL